MKRNGIFFLSALFTVAYSLGILAAEFPDAALEPTLTLSAGEQSENGAILEYWLRRVNEQFKRRPVEPSTTGMIDDSEQVFYASSMLRDPEMKTYLNRQGLLQWTTYFNVKKPGKHVFVMTTTGTDEFGWADHFERSGVVLFINDEGKIATAYNKSASATVDFAQPGLYKFQVCTWYTHKWNRLNWQDVRVSIKVREPGSLSQRQMTAKDFFYQLPD